MLPFLKNRTSFLRNWTVRVREGDGDMVYSPGRKRKKKAMVSRSAIAKSRSLPLLL
jgi:hypothetical protein